MQENGSSETSSHESAPNAPPLPDQLVKLASGSLHNAVNQLSRIVEGRLQNLKVSFPIV